MTITYHWRCAGANYHLWDDRGLVGAIEPLPDGRHAFVLRTGQEIFRAELPHLFEVHCWLLWHPCCQATEGWPDAEDSASAAEAASDIRIF